MFLTARHYSNSQNSMISYVCVDFYPKDFLILYPSPENSITSIAIVQTVASVLTYLVAFEHHDSKDKQVSITFILIFLIIVRTTKCTILQIIVLGLYLIYSFFCKNKYLYLKLCRILKIRIQNTLVRDNLFLALL